MANAAALQKPLQPSAELAAVIGPGPHTRAEATSKLWGLLKVACARNKLKMNTLILEGVHRTLEHYEREVA